MTAPVFFNVPAARQQLAKQGACYTLRRERSTGRSTARYGSYYRAKFLGKVEITLIAPDAPDSVLGRYVEASGFKTIADWRTAADVSATHLYLVRIMAPWEYTPANLAFATKTLRQEQAQERGKKCRYHRRGCSFVSHSHRAAGRAKNEQVHAKTCLFKGKE